MTWEEPHIVRTTVQAMSTTVPTSPASRRRARTRMAVLAPIHAIATAIAAYLAVAQILSLATGADPFAGAADALDEQLLGMFAFPLAIVVASLLGFSMQWSSVRAYGTFLLGTAASNAWTLLGVTAGLLSALVLGAWRVQPTMVGVMELPTSVDGIWTWASAAAPVLLPAVTGALALAHLLAFSIGLSRSERAASTAATLRAHGVRVRGRVERVSFTNTWVLGLPQFLVDVSYVTTSGPRRVERRVTTAPTLAPQPGGMVEVWYDPSDPAKAEVELGTAASPWLVDPRLYAPPHGE